MGTGSAVQEDHAGRAGGLPAVESLPGGFVTSGQDALIATCGCIADWQYRGQKLRGSQIAILLLGGPDDRFERDDASTGQAVVSTGRASAVAPGADLYRLASKAASEHWAAARCIALWRGSEAFAASCRPAIDAVAAALLERGELNYAEVNEIATTAMADHPAPEVPEWAIDVRAWGQIEQLRAILGREQRVLGAVDMRRTVRWWVAGLVVVAAFGAATWVSGVFVLPLVMKSEADRWVVAAGLGVAVAALVALWGQSWATRESAGELGTEAGKRSIAAARDISGIASTGDDATNTQLR